MAKAVLDRNIRPAVLGIDDLGETQNIGMDVDSKSLNVNLRVWDSDLLQWVRMTQPVPADISEQSVRDIRVAYDPGTRIKYYGEHEVMGAPEDDPGWMITYLEYNNDGMITRIQTQERPWSSYSEGWL